MKTKDLENQTERQKPKARASRSSSEKNTVLKICFAALMAAIITVFTAFVKFNTGINNGYLHFGDSMVYLAGCLLGPVGMLSSAIGGALADIIAGSAMWAFPTAIIKALNCSVFVLALWLYKKKKPFRIVNAFTVTTTVISGLITIFGYLVAEGLMYSFPSAWTSVPFSCIQAAGSAVIFVVFGAALDKTKINKLLRR